MKSQGSFDYCRPTSLAEASSVLLEADQRAALLAGGTDLLVRIKRSLVRPDVVLDLNGLGELRQLTVEPDALSVGALVSPVVLATHPLVQQHFPAVAQAARLVGGSQIRQMATLGGAVCTGLRCQFRDQSAFWRQTQGPCLRDGGPGCHAQPEPTCQATVACDLPPALVASQGQAVLQGPGGVRTLPLERLYSGEGQSPYLLQPGEILTGVRLPWPPQGQRRLAQYEKARLRQAVDRPLVGVAVNLGLDSAGSLAGLRIVLCGNGPAVVPVPDTQSFIGARLDSDVIEALGRRVQAWFRPSPALRIDVWWRRAMALTLTRRALLRLAEVSQDLQPAAPSPSDGRQSPLSEESSWPNSSLPIH